MTYYERNREKALRRAREVVRPQVMALRREVLSLLGDRCQRCGFDDYRALQIDHVHGGGIVENKRWGAGPLFLKNVIHSISYGENKYQLLCANCNWIKKHERGEFSGSASVKATHKAERTLFDG